MSDAAEGLQEGCQEKAIFYLGTGSFFAAVCEKGACPPRCGALRNSSNRLNRRTRQPRH